MGVVGPEVVLAAPARDVPSIPVRADTGVIADALVPFSRRRWWWATARK